MPTVGGYVGTMRCDATDVLAVPGRAVSKGALSWRRSRRAPPGARVICTPMVVWDGSWQSVSAWRCWSCRVAGWDAKAELATGCCAFGRVEGGVGRGSCAVRLGIDWLGSAVARRGTDANQMRGERQATDGRGPALVERGASPALLRVWAAADCRSGDLPSCTGARCSWQNSKRLRIDVLEAMEGGLRLRFIASSAWLRTAAPSPLAPKGRSVLACSTLTTV